MLSNTEVVSGFRVIFVIITLPIIDNYLLFKRYLETGRLMITSTQACSSDDQKKTSLPWAL